MKTLAIIPARGGSKRIPKKNIKDFLGRPIISYSIRTAIESCLFDEIMVSTDSEEIANIALKYGATVPFLRSSENSNDYATTLNVINEVVGRYEQVGEKPASVCCIYPTAPLINVKSLSDGYFKLIDENYKSVVPVVEFSYPVWRGFILNGHKLSMKWPENINKRSQDLEKLYHDAGQWYWLNSSEIGESIFTDRTGYLVLNELEVQDIDSPTDWAMAELKYKIINSQM